MEHKLSVIMPCYSCSATLREAVDSIFVQDMEISFEIIMVDDGSTDRTKELIVELSKEHSEIRYFFHEKNMGGGAARNTAVKNSTGDLIFCLDSDDILPPNMLQKMVDFLLEKKCDGVLFEESRFFIKRKKNVSSSSFNTIGDEPCALKDLFDGTRGMLTVVNFLYTKRAFEMTRGYPVNHGFDTQGFGYRFLSKDLSVFVCPNTFYYHRQHTRKKSYFNRVYESGRYSLNFYYIYEEIFHLFSPEVKGNIIMYDIFNNTKFAENDLDTYIKKIYKEKGEKIFLDNYHTYQTVDGFERFVKDHAGDGFPNIICEAIDCHRKKEFGRAIDCYKEISSRGNGSKLVYFNALRSLSGKLGFADPEKEAVELINDLTFKKQRATVYLPTYVLKILVKIKKSIYHAH